MTVVQSFVFQLPCPSDNSDNSDKIRCLIPLPPRTAMTTLQFVYCLLRQFQVSTPSSSQPSQRFFLTAPPLSIRMIIASCLCACKYENPIRKAISASWCANLLCCSSQIAAKSTMMCGASDSFCCSLCIMLCQRQLVPDSCHSSESICAPAGANLLGGAMPW